MQFGFMSEDNVFCFFRRAGRSFIGTMLGSSNRDRGSAVTIWGRPADIRTGTRRGNMERKKIARASALWVSTVVLLFVAAANGQTPTTAIKVDQVGYLPVSPKVAMVAEPAKSFTVNRAGDNEVVFKGALGAPAKDPDTGDTVQAADFSSLSNSGDYYLDVPGVGRSWTFSIRPDVYTRAYYLAMKGFYGLRCGTAVDLGPEFPGYSHPACHLKGEFHSSSGKSGPYDDAGGWHDAGDYGRYIPNSGFTVGALMWAWEFYGPKLKEVSLKVPESGNGTPDILNETRWNLEWMFKMQDADGGVWHKQTSEKFPGFVMPQDDTTVSEVIGTGSQPYKDTCSTADLAASGAIAARVYKPYDAKFAERSLAAARKAWAWTKQNPNVTFKNPRGVSTGEYGDRNCGDERLWAAAELWRTTGEREFGDFVVANYATYLDELPNPLPESWGEMTPFAIWTYVLAGREGADPKAVAHMRERTLASAKEIVARTHSSAYRVSLTARDYHWGSNGDAAEQGVQLLVANELSPNPEFVNAAADELHYLLGRNTFSVSFVTQLGANPIHHPHHRPSGARSDREPWPGLLSGGPNTDRQDDVLRRLPANLPPAKVFADETGSYASNEIAINWQAMLVFLLAGQMQ
jgi:endoglucanase